ncbi:MAG TPA: hypothetical protein DIT98_07045 [Verrucomicrobiales bacterium]|nr:hypothetical protein [Verrucomicrobiales bacterium]
MQTYNLRGFKRPSIFLGQIFKKQFVTYCLFFFFSVSGITTCFDRCLAKDANPLKVFLLVGQSNMQGHAHIRTFEHIAMDPETLPLLREMWDEEKQPRICDKVWISYLSTSGVKQGQLSVGFGASEDKIGPEYTFGICMQKHLKQPILIIKTAWGGKSLHTDFRSPSAGPYLFTEQQIEGFAKQGKDLKQIKAERARMTGLHYRLMIGHVERVLQNIKSVYPDYNEQHGYELAGMVWFQGWNDMVDRGAYPDRDRPGGYDRYSEALGHFIRDVRRDLSAPDLPFVIGVIGVGGPVKNYGAAQKRYAGIHQYFRSAMAAPATWPEFDGNVSSVLTENYWDMELTALRARDAELNQKMKQLVSNGNLQKKEQQSMREKLRAEMFTKRELETLQKGVSNQEYHYLGSAKIMAQIGRGFAESMAQLMGPSSN